MCVCVCVCVCVCFGRVVCVTEATFAVLTRRLQSETRFVSFRFVVLIFVALCSVRERLSLSQRGDAGGGVVVGLQL